MNEPSPIVAEVLPPEEAVIDAEVLAPQGQPCTSCGCPVEPGDQFCPACGTPSTWRKPPAAGRPAVDVQKHFECKTCGAKVHTDPDQRSYVCPFCDSTYVVEFDPQTTGRQPPEFIIGFRVTPEEALAAFRRWLRDNGWFRPGDLHSATIEKKLKGVYLPFWSFSMLAQSNWAADIGEYWYRTETYTTRDSQGRTVTRTRRVRETEWWPLAGRHHRYYSGHLVSGSKGLTQREADRIKPFQLPALKRYAPYFLAGWLSEEYSVDRAAAEELCRGEFYRREQANVAAFLPGDTHRNLRVSTTFSHIGSDLCLLPVYMLSYRYKNKLYRFLLNGQTGKAAGDKPVSWARIWLVIGGAAAALAVLVLLALLAAALGGG